MSDCGLLDTRPGHCGWCSKELTGRQVKWCCRHCNRMYVANHRWTQAKQEAKRERTWYLCENAFPLGFLAGSSPSAHMSGPEGCEVFTQRPEVNHKNPIRGKHATWGCHHHAIGLEVLCRPCHLKATAQQREEGKFS